MNLLPPPGPSETQRTLVSNPTYHTSCISQIISYLRTDHLAEIISRLLLGVEVNLHDRVLRNRVE